jgi:hypothetical protein
VWAF